MISPGVRAHNGALAITMAQEMMAAFNAQSVDTGLCERCNEVLDR